MKQPLTFVNAEAREKANPLTFQIPARANRDMIRPGMWIKVVVEWEGPSFNGERFWLKVLTSETAVVDNELLFTAIHGYRAGQVVAWNPAHVLAILDEKSELIP